MFTFNSYTRAGDRSRARRRKRLARGAHSRRSSIFPCTYIYIHVCARVHTCVSRRFRASAAPLYRLKIDIRSHAHVTGIGNLYFNSLVASVNQRFSTFFSSLPCISPFFLFSPAQRRSPRKPSPGKAAMHHRAATPDAERRNSKPR